MGIPYRLTITLERRTTQMSKGGTFLKAYTRYEHALLVGFQRQFLSVTLHTKNLVHSEFNLPTPIPFCQNVHNYSLVMPRRRMGLFAVVGLCRHWRCVRQASGTFPNHKRYADSPGGGSMNNMSNMSLELASGYRRCISSASARQ